MSCCSPAREGSVVTSAATVSIEGGGLPSDRVLIPGGKSFVGTDTPELPYDGEGPKRWVRLRPFWLEVAPVTNERFAEFVEATGYATEAERFGWSAVFRGLLGEAAPPLSNSPTPWWVKIDGAYWKSPEGPGTSIVGREKHPATHVSWADANAFASWCGARLPYEAEWEHAARGGLADPRFPWGDEEPDDTHLHANIWQGNFPDTNSMLDGYLGTSPVDAFPPNGLGLYSMVGNTWEWMNDAFRVRSLSGPAKSRNEHARRTNEKVMKGGSFLCHKSYCYRYRIAARSALTAESSASNIGFRLAYDAV